MRPTTIARGLAVLWTAGCGPLAGPSGVADSGNDDASAGGTGSSDVSVSGAQDVSSTIADSSAGSDDASDEAPKFDVPGPDGGPLDGGTTCDGECRLDAQVCIAADGSGRPVIDCGAVDLGDDVDAWQAAHDCAAQAFSSGSGVVVLWQETDRGMGELALVGVDGEPDIIVELRSEGTRTGDAIWATRCSAVVEPAECVAAVGRICLACVPAARPELVCEVPCKTCPPG